MVIDFENRYEQKTYSSGIRMPKLLALIHASLDFKQKMIDAQQFFDSTGVIEAILPELTRYQHIRDEYGDDHTFTQIKTRLTRDNMANVKRVDCLLILNYDHRGFKNYVGGNSFLEMAIAFFLEKPIFILNPIPEEMPYSEEIKALNPIVASSLAQFQDLAIKLFESRLRNA